MTLVMKPGDILVVRGGGLASTMIRLGAALHNRPNLDGHVAIMHHYDSSGVPWGLEGKPGGVGWRDLRDYLKDPWMFNNCLQPGRRDLDRELFAQDAVGMIGTPYDWRGILGDGFDDMNVKLWNPEWAPGQKPGAVVCSSYAAYLYEKYKWDHPSLGDERYCQPSDWDEYVITGHLSAS